MNVSLNEELAQMERAVDMNALAAQIASGADRFRRDLIDFIGAYNDFHNFTEMMKLEMGDAGYDHLRKVSGLGEAYGVLLELHRHLAIALNDPSLG